jgi:hypothetical protein
MPVSDGFHVYGQVVDKDGPQHLVVIFSAVGSMEEALRGSIDLAGIVFDAKLRNGDWPIIANAPVAPLRTPMFVLGHEGVENLRLESFDGKTSRLVRSDEASTHRHRNLSAPMLLQMAAEAHHGLAAWKGDYDHFRALAEEMSNAAL